MWWSDWGRNHVFHIGVDVRQRFLLNRSTCNERWHRGRATRGLLDSICWMVYYRFWFAIWEQPSSFPPLPRKSKHDFGLFGASPSSTSVDNKQMQNCYFERGSQPPDMFVLDANKNHQMAGSQVWKKMQTTIWTYVIFPLGTENLPCQQCWTVTFPSMNHWFHFFELW